VRRGKESSPADNADKTITLQDNGRGDNTEGTSNDTQKVNQTKPREEDEQQVTQQTLIREEVQGSSEMETEVEQIMPRTDNGQEHKEYGDR
jgi:hypothetical protein